MRRQHNRLYFGKYTNKMVFNMPWACYLWPTDDRHLQQIIDQNSEEFKSDTAFRGGKFVRFTKHVEKLRKLARFILNNKKKIKFRIQHIDFILYSNETICKEFVSVFWDEWKNATEVEKSHLLSNNTVICKKLPLGRYQYQIHFKKNIHRILKQQQREDLYRYLSNNRDNCAITNQYVKEYLTGQNNYGWQGYFYVTEEKFLTPIYMIAQEAIEKVIKFIKVE